MDVFNLKAKISLDTSGYESGLKQASGLGSDFGSKLAGMMQNVTGTIVNLTKTAAAEASGFLRDSIETGKSFDSAMSQVAATMGTTADQITELRDFAQEMGASTQFSATQAAEALNYMALAGYDAETSMEMLPNVLNLAAAGGMELARASDMVTDTQSAFGISLSRTKQMVDEMAKAASTGNTNVEQLGDAFLTVGALAQELNGGFVTLSDGTKANADGIQELEIALTMMANAGIKGSEAGTHMRNMLLKLADQTPEGAQAFTDLGVAVYDSAGQMRSLKDIFGDMNTAMSKLTQQDKLQKISAIFNTRDTASAEAIMNAMAQDWDRIGEAILDANGAAGAMAETQLDNLAGDVTILKSAWEGVQIAVSDLVSPQLRTGVQFVTDTLSNLTNALRGNGQGGIEAVWDSAIGKIRTKIAEFVTYDLPELPGKIWDALGKIGDKIAAEANSWKWIGEQLFSEVVGGMTELSEQSDQIIPTLTNLAAQITNPEHLSALKDTAVPIIQNVIDGLTSQESLDAFFDTENGLPKVFKNIATSFTSIAESFIDLSCDLIENILTYMVDPKNKETIDNGVTDILTTLGEGFERLVSCIYGNITDMMADVAAQMVGDFDADATALEMLSKLGTALVKNLWKSTIPGALMNLIGGLADISEMETYGKSEEADRYGWTYDEWKEALEGPWETPEEYEEFRRKRAHMNEVSAQAAANLAAKNAPLLPNPAADAYAEAAADYAKRNNIKGVPVFGGGGIVDRPTLAVVGDAGREAIVPLERESEVGRMFGGISITFTGDIYAGSGEIGREIVRQIDTALRSYQIQQARGIGGTAWQT